MQIVNVHQAKTLLSRLLTLAKAGEDIVIASIGRPIARLVRCQQRGNRQFGALKGRRVVNDSFFNPLSEAELSTWEASRPKLQPATPSWIVLP